MEFYDLYISIGSACRPAHHLARQGLRVDAFPMDWQKEYSLDTVLHLFETSFEDFFENIEEGRESAAAGNNRTVIDVSNRITSIHHFPKNMQICEMKMVFVEKMRARFRRLDAGIRNADRIVLIGNRSEPVEELQVFLQNFSKIYPNVGIRMINMRDTALKENELYEDTVFACDKLSLVEYTFNDSMNIETGEQYDWRGNLQKWNAVLSGYGLQAFASKMETLKREDSVVIYGAGKESLGVIHTLRKYGVPINGIAVTDTEKNPKCIEGIAVFCIEKYERDSLIIISVQSERAQAEIKRVLDENGYIKYILYNNGKWTN